MKDFEFQDKKCNIYSVIDSMAQLKKKMGRREIDSDREFQKHDSRGFPGDRFFFTVKLGKIIFTGQGWF